MLSSEIGCLRTTCVAVGLASARFVGEIGGRPGRIEHRWLVRVVERKRYAGWPFRLLVGSAPCHFSHVVDLSKDDHIHFGRLGVSATMRKPTSAMSCIRALRRRNVKDLRFRYYVIAVANSGRVRRRQDPPRGLHRDRSVIEGNRLHPSLADCSQGTTCDQLWNRTLAGSPSPRNACTPWSVPQVGCRVCPGLRLPG